MHFALRMQCLFSSLILIYKKEPIMQFITNFLRLLDAPLFEECTGVCCETCRSCCLGAYLIFHRAQCADKPCWGSSWGWIMPWSLCSSIPYLCWCQPTQEPRAAIPSFSPTPTRHNPHPRRESDSDPSIPQRDQSGTQSLALLPLLESKVCGFVYSWATLLAQETFR